MEATGLVLGFIAGLLLAYPILWGYPKSNRRAIRQSQLEQLHQFMDEMDLQTDALPSPPWTTAEKEREKKKFHDKWDAKADQIAKEIQELGPGHEYLSFILSALGILLFTLGFGAQLWGLYTRPGEQRWAMPGIELVRDSLGAFVDASATEPSGKIRSRACAIRKLLTDTGVTVAMVVGRFDERSIARNSRSGFDNNARLAQARADSVASILTNPSLCPSASIHHVIASIGGPRAAAAGTGALAVPANALAGDRAVDVYGIRLRSRSAP